MNRNMRKMYTEEQIAKLGGTKLYKHTISIKNINIEIVSSMSDEATSASLLDNVISKSISSTCILGGDSGLCFCDYENSMFVIIHYSDTALSVDEIIDYNNTPFTDAVTEL